ncbi:MAG: LysR family transcriptional regulator, partial [Mixta calida]|nr:LysR family transcriptional regulator [Mixta calida]
RLLYPRAVGLLEQAADIEQLFREDNGAIRLYASSTIGNYLLPGMLAVWRRDYPQLPLELSVGNSQDVINAVADFRVDLGLIEGPCHLNDIVSEPWLEDELVVFAAPEAPLLQQPVTLESLAAAPWILREHGSGTREIVDYLLLSHLPQFQLALELGNSEAIKHAVRHGMGISCLSRRVIAEQLETGSLVEVPIPLPKLSRTLYRIHHRQKHISRALERFLSYCRE